jgi:hypothetical protein
MGLPALPTENHDSDEATTPSESSPPHTASAPHSVISIPSVTSSNKHKRAAFDSISESLHSSSSLGLGPTEKKQHNSGVAALSGIKESINIFTSTMHNSMPVALARAADQAAAY